MHYDFASQTVRIIRCCRQSVQARFGTTRHLVISENESGVKGYNYPFTAEIEIVASNWIKSNPAIFFMDGINKNVDKTFWKTCSQYINVEKFQFYCSICSKIWFIKLDTLIINQLPCLNESSSFSSCAEE